MQSTQRDKDKHLREAVVRQIAWEPEITSRDISVAAREGVVTLTGFVHSYGEKISAEKAAKSVYGARAVANDIEVKPMTRTDPEIARDVLHAMKIDMRVPDDRLTVGVQGGFVTLEGSVEWNYQREGAASCARNVNGVRDVNNKIEVKPRASTAEVKTKILEALRRSAEVDASGISVSAQDDAITLHGNVRSLFEKEEAARAAWAAPGVSRVINDIVVVP